MKWVLGLAAVALLLGGCSSRPQRPPLDQRTPDYRLTVSHQLGSPLSANRQPDGATVPLVVTLRGHAVEQVPTDLGVRAAARSPLIMVGTNEPVPAAASLSETLRILTDVSPLPTAAVTGGTAFGAVSQPMEHRLVIPAGSSGTIRLSPMARDGVDVELTVSGPGLFGSSQPTLLLRTFAPQQATSAEPDEPIDPTPLGQSVLIDWPLDASEGSIGLTWPSLPQLGLPQAMVFQIDVARVQPGTDEATEAESIAARLAAERDAPPAPAVRNTITGALEGAVSPEQQRRAIVFIAREVGADLAAEAALLADSVALPRLAETAAGVIEQTSPGANPQAFGWLLDRGTIVSLATLHGENTLAPELSAMLSARYGEVGRDPSTLGELATASANRDDFRTRLEGEHLILLEDISPAARVRAFEWMRAQELAPDAYDPLASPRDRRIAIEAHLQPATQPTTQPSAQP